MFYINLVGGNEQYRTNIIQELFEDNELVALIYARQVQMIE